MQSMPAFSKPSDQPTAVELRLAEEKLVSKAVDALRAELRDFSTEHGIRSMNSRWRRGMNPAAILAIGQTRKVIEDIVKKLSPEHSTSVMAELTQIVTDIQEGGPWKYADRLREATDPAIKLWYLLQFASVSGRDRATERQLTQKEFLDEVDTTKRTLEGLSLEDDSGLGQAVTAIRLDAAKNLRIESGVPITQSAYGFIDMAIQGYKSGVFQDADGMLYVGAENIPNELFSAWGLDIVEENKNNKTIQHFTSHSGDTLVQKTGPGFAIIRSRNFGLAKAIAQASVSENPLSIIPPEGSLGHVMYESTSVAKNKELTADVGIDKVDDERTRKAFLRRRREDILLPPVETTAMVRSIDEFYHGLGFIRSMHVFLDAWENKRLEKLKKNKPLTAEDFDKESRKVARKQQQKIEELRYLNSIFEKYLDVLPPGTNTIVDVAGGAGDLGLALSTLFLSKGRELKETRIADPFSSSFGFDYFMDTMLDYLPFRDELREKVTHTNENAQEVEMPADAVIVAKHSCGTLSDDIIERWASHSKSPLLMIMTCCHNKAVGEPARYGMNQQEWDSLCKETGKASNEDTKRRAEGMAALTKLDEARVAYLRRRGFDAVLTQTDKFPMGDVLVIQRRPGSKHK